MHQDELKNIITRRREAFRCSRFTIQKQKLVENIRSRRPVATPPRIIKVFGLAVLKSVQIYDA